MIRRKRERLPIGGFCGEFGEQVDRGGMMKENPGLPNGCGPRFSGKP